MKKLSVILFLCVSFCNYIFASVAHPGPYLRIQPNGDSIYVYWRADEYGGYYTDLKKNVVDKNEEGYWVYVMAENNKIVLTNQIVTSTSVPINVNRKSVFNLISQKRMEARQKRLRYNTRSGQTQSVKLPSIGQPRVLTVLVQFPDVEFQSSSSIVEHVKNMMKILYLMHIMKFYYCKKYGMNCGKDYETTSPLLVAEKKEKKSLLKRIWSVVWKVMLLILLVAILYGVYQVSQQPTA